MPPDEPGAEHRAPDLRHLKWLAVILPIAGVVVGEVFRSTFIEPSIVDAGLQHLVAGSLAVAAIVGFGGLMFIGIERAQRRLLRQNRALRIANAVSVAVQGERPLDEVIQRALATVVDATGARDAAVTVFASEPNGHPGREGTVHRLGRPAQPAPGDVPTIVDIPLSTGTSLVGKLQLEMAGEPDPGAIPQRVLQNIGHQMATAIQAGQLIADLRRRRQEAAALYDVALQVTSRYALSDILGTIVHDARALLDVDEAIICLSDAASNAMRAAQLVNFRNVAQDGTVCFSPLDEPISMRHEGAAPGYCPVRSSPLWGATADAPLRSADTALGSLWVARRASRPIDESGRELLAGLADLAAIAIVSARLREGERQTAILSERERIAREMHDSLAQVLATNHLRLRSLEERPEVRGLPDVAAEIAALGDLTHDAYRDVREAILGLRESSRTDRHLLESLRVYLDKYSRQAGVQATLETTADAELGLPLATEIQVIRVIQEALTNVRKHAGARVAVVHVDPDESSVTLTVEDDGRGFDPATELVSRDDSFGIRTMRERMELVGGTLSVDSAPGRGTRVTAHVPRPVLVAPRRIEVPDADRESHAKSCWLTISRCFGAPSRPSSTTSPTSRSWDRRRTASRPWRWPASWRRTSC